jgi:hypothetical protein
MAMNKNTTVLTWSYHNYYDNGIMFNWLSAFLDMMMMMLLVGVAAVGGFFCIA